MKLLIGADPELFVQGVKDGKFYSAHNMIEGTKYAPQKVDFGAHQVDGMALEFNINPAATVEEFTHHILAVKKSLHETIGMGRFNLCAFPSVKFSKSVWNKTPEVAKILGCIPDYNAWINGGLENPAPHNQGTLRTGAGHIHIGWGEDFEIKDKGHIEECVGLVQQLDLSVGLASLVWDKDYDRRKLYGKAGAFRPKTYGCEYRVLSNAWLQQDNLIKYVYDATVKASEDYFNGIHYIEHVNAQTIVSFINNGETNKRDEDGITKELLMMKDTFEFPVPWAA